MRNQKISVAIAATAVVVLAAVLSGAVGGLLLMRFTDRRGAIAITPMPVAAFALFGQALALIDRELALRLGARDGDFSIRHEFKMSGADLVGIRLLGRRDGNVGLFHR